MVNNYKAADVAGRIHRGRVYILFIDIFGNLTSGSIYNLFIFYSIFMILRDLFSVHMIPWDTKTKNVISKVKTTITQLIILLYQILNTHLISYCINM